MRDQGGSPQLEEDIKRLEKEIEMYSQEKLCYEAQVLRVCLVEIAIIYSQHLFFFV